jgi:hypothetical protein
MPRIYNLGEYSDKLEKIHLIIGEGLCSNIYVIDGDLAVVVDTGIGYRKSYLIHERGGIATSATGNLPIKFHGVNPLSAGAHHRLNLTSLRTMMEIIKIIKTTTIVSVVPTPNG